VHYIACKPIGADRLAVPCPNNIGWELTDHPTGTVEIQANGMMLSNFSTTLGTCFSLLEAPPVAAVKTKLPSRTSMSEEGTSDDLKITRAC
jgi:hypothetical protein